MKLSRITQRWRFRTAIAVALLYAFSVLAPSAVLAAADNPESAHCLMQQEAGSHQHVHGGGAQKHQHAKSLSEHEDEHGDMHKSSDAGDKSHPRCCGLFCVTALAGEESLELVTPGLSNFGRPGRDSDFADRSPDRIIRPPIA